METVLLAIPLLVTLVVGAILFLIREKRFAPWVWVPVSAWSLWKSLGLLLGVFMMRNTRPEPREGLWLGFDPLTLYAVLCAGLVGLAVWLGFPRKTTWRDKSWAGGVLVLIGVPLLMEGLKVLFRAGSGSGSIWLIAFLAAGIPAVVVAVLLFLLRKKAGAPWIWVPVVGWMAWAGLNLLPTFLPRDPIYGPPEWSPYGFDALFAAVALAFFGLVILGGLTAFPRRSAWSVKPWVGGMALALGLPFIVWITCTIPCTLQLIGPDGNPVKGVEVFKLIPGKGSRLAEVDTKVSDDDGVVHFRKFPGTDMDVLVLGSGLWERTKIRISPPGHSQYAIGIFDFTEQITLNWGGDMGSAFAQAFRSRSDLERNARKVEVSGQAAWILRDSGRKQRIPVFLHSGARPVHAELLELMRSQIKDRGLMERYADFINAFASGHYGLLLGPEICSFHNGLQATEVNLEVTVRTALYSQAYALADSRQILNADTVKTEAFRKAREGVESAANELLEHIRRHPMTSEDSLNAFESRLKIP